MLESTKRGWLAGIAIAIATSACAPEPLPLTDDTLATTTTAAPGDIGQVQFALTTVPSDALCLRITASTPGRQVVQHKSLSAGASSSKITVGGLPLGVIQLSAEAFSAACSSSTSTSVPTYLSEVLTLTVAENVVQTVPLVMRRPGQINATVDFLACNNKIDDKWTYSLTDASSPWRRAFGDPAINLGSQYLELSFDDIVRRASNYTSGYYFKFTALFEDNVVLHPNFEGISGEGAQTHPALWYNGQRTILGGASYGSNTFGTFGSFTGQAIPNNYVTVTIYVKAGARQLAMRVDEGGTTYRSGFVTFNVNNLTPLMVGGNNVNINGPRKVYLGAFKGCQGYNDSEIQSAYDATAN